MGLQSQTQLSAAQPQHGLKKVHVLSVFELLAKFYQVFQYIIYFTNGDMPDGH